MGDTQNELAQLERERLGNRLQAASLWGTTAQQATTAYREDVPMETLTQEDRDKTYGRIPRVAIASQIDQRPEEYRHGIRDHSGALGTYVGGSGAASDNPLIKLKEELSKAYQMVSDTDLSTEALSALTFGKVGAYIHDGLSALQEGKNPLEQFSVNDIDPNERGAAYLLGRVIAGGKSIKRSTEKNM